MGCADVRLSQCMIVKNEETNIERALSWGKDIVYEQIVVDTGSTDRTVELARAMGAKVYDFEWIDDFAAAKNYAISKASGPFGCASINTYCSALESGSSGRGRKADAAAKQTGKDTVLCHAHILDACEPG